MKGSDSFRNGWLGQRKAGFFAFLSTLYLLVLLVLLMSRQLHWLGVDRFPSRIAGVVPLAIPWFGALGAVTVSLYGVFDHSGAPGRGRHSWDARYNYWHALRPLMGAVLGTVAYLIFTGFVNATASGGGGSAIPKTAEKTIPYLVIAFVVGYRESTFRKLIANVVDTILGPGIPGVTPSAGIAVAPSPVDFGAVAVGNPSDPKIVRVSNTGTHDLVIHAMSEDPAGVTIDGTGFQIRANSVAGAVIPPNAEAALSIVFMPDKPESYTGTLTIQSNAGSRTVPLSGQGKQ